MRYVYPALILSMIVKPSYAEALPKSDQGLLEYVRAATTAYSTKYPHGKAKVEFMTYWGAPTVVRARPETKKAAKARPAGSPDIFGEVELIWDESNQLAKYRGYTEGATDGSLLEATFLRSSKVFASYARNSNILRLYPPTKIPVFEKEYLLLTPKDAWFQIPPLYEELKWGALLSNTEGLAVTEHEDVIRVVIPKPKEAKITVDFSKKHHGFPLLLEFVHNAKGDAFVVRWKWRIDSNGRSILEEEEENILQRGKSDRRRVLKVLEFDSDFSPGRNQFELSALNVKTGAFVEDFLNSRKYQWGTKGEPASETLQELIDKVSKQGFADPGNR